MAKIKLPGCPPPHRQEKLCATKNRHNYLKFCAFAKKNRSFFDKPRLQRLPKRSSVPQKTGITILSFVPLQRKTAVSLTNQGCKGCQNEALCHKKPANYRKNSAQAEFLCFCVFAGKNAVYLANQSCKDGKSEALCHKSTA